MSEPPMVITLTCLVALLPAIFTVCGVPLCANENWPDRCRKSATEIET